MLTVCILGGLGNQMYTYALYRTLLERGRDVYMDISCYNHQNNPLLDHKEYELADVFNITERLAPKMSDLKYFMMRVVKKLKVPGLMNMHVDKTTHFQPEVLNLKSGILWGWWQSFKYSAEIENILRKEFTFKKPLTGKSAEVIDRIRNCNSVSISIRRGDYLNLSQIFNILPVDYYTNAINYIQERVPNAKFFCTSDDIDWCKGAFSDRQDFEFIDWSLGKDQYFDLQVIQECKHNILANSTFCLWGAWLNQNPEKIVIRPEKFFSDGRYRSERKDFWSEDWIVIPSQSEIDSK